MEKFRKLGIIEPILKVIEEEEFEKPTEIQEKSIPLVVSGKDVIAGSATGSGKTLAFGSGIIQNVEKRKGIGALVLAPTRELAEQVSGSLKKFAKYQPLNIVTVYGGVSIVPQTRNLRKADVVVGTPGRILDHISRRSINLSKVKILVLDEADRMLDMGFIDDVKKIIRECPSYRQTLLFSATISSEITKLAQKYMKTPVEVSAKSHVDPTKLSQSYYEVTDGLKFSLLVTLLRKEKEGLVMVFCNTRRNVDFVAENLKFSEINAIAIHGGFSQEKRTKTMKYFNSKNGDVLVCTDVAARGLDIPGVTHVYNYDIPNDSKEYVHRIGRTARAGKNGKAINILTTRDHNNFRQVMRVNNIDIDKDETPFIERVPIKKTEKPSSSGFRDSSRHGGGGRPGRKKFPRR